MSYSQSSPLTGGILAPFTAGTPFSAIGGVIDPRTGRPITDKAAYGPTGIPLASDPNATAYQRAGSNGLPGSVPVVGALPNRQPTSQTTQPTPEQLPFMGPTDDFGSPVNTRPEANLPQLPAPPASGNPADQTGGTGFLTGFEQPDTPAPSPSKATSNLFDQLDERDGTAFGGRPAAAAPSTSTGFATRESAATDPQAYTGPPTPGNQLDRLWTKITGGESGGSADPTHAKNPHSSAYGAAQFIDSTRDAFLASTGGKYSVDDFRNNPAVQREAFNWLVKQNAAALAPYSGGGEVPDGALEAAHALGVRGVISLMQKPGEKAVAAYNAGTGRDNGQAALIGNNPAWGIKPDDTADAALHKIAAYYEKRRGGSQPASATTQTASATPPADQPAPKSDAPSAFDAPGVGSAAPEPLPGQLPGYSPVQPSDKMLALASGILQGGPGTNGLVRGFGVGIDKMQKLGMDDQAQRFKISQEMANTALLKKRLDLVGAQTDKTSASIDQKTRDQDLREQQIKNQAAFQQQRIGVMNDRLALGRDNLQATLDGSKSFGGKIGADSAATAHQMASDTSAAANDLQQISDLRTAIAASPGAVGQQYKDQAARFLADKFGIDVGVNPTTTAITDKLVAAFNNASALQGGKGIGGRITQQEFGQFQKSAAGLQTRPEAWKEMLDTYEQAAQRRLDVANQFAQLRKDPKAFHDALTSPTGLGGWYSDRIGYQNEQRGIVPTAAAPSQYQQGPNGSLIHRGGGANGVPAYTVERLN